MTEAYDSTQDTLAHIRMVQDLISEFTKRLTKRGIDHDASKLLEPEKSAFDENTQKLRGLTYGSPEYKASLDAMRPAIDHHQKSNSHHPEFYENGINGMSLLDLVEMCLDWRAAGMRHADGCFAKSVEHNRKRFQMSDQLAEIFLNTKKEMGW